MLPVMNNTKWDELRLAMYGLEPSPKFVTLATNGCRGKPDREWFYHFREGGYEDNEAVDILVDSLEQREEVRAALRKIHVPGEEIANGFRVLGYLREGDAADYI